MKTDMDVRNPWPGRAHEEVSGLRKAITNHLDEPLVASSAAPMLGELLTRLEGFATPMDPGQLRSPVPPERGLRPGDGEADAILHQVCDGLEQRIMSGVDNPRTSQSLQAMVEVIEEYLAMKGEVVARSTSDATPG